MGNDEFLLLKNSVPESVVDGEARLTWLPLTEETVDFLTERVLHVVEQMGLDKSFVFALYRSPHVVMSYNISPDNLDTLKRLVENGGITKIGQDGRFFSTTTLVATNNDSLFVWGDGEINFASSTKHSGDVETGQFHINTIRELAGMKPVNVSNGEYDV